MTDLNSRLETQRLEINQLQRSVVQKCMQVNEERAANTRLLALVESNAYDLTTKNEQLTEYANTVSSLLKKRRGLENTVSILKDQLKRKESEWKCQEFRLQQEIQDLQSKLAEQLKTGDVAEKLPMRCGNIPTKTSHKTSTMVIGGGSFDKEGFTKYNFDATMLTGLQNNKLTRVSNRDDVKKAHVTDHIEDENIGETCISCPPYSTDPRRSLSKWIDTRCQKSHKGPDPHDDFLDTPFDNIMDALVKQKSVYSEITGINNPNSYQGVCQDSNEIMHVVSPQIKYTPSTGKRIYRYVDTVRKKSEREHLNGIECKQCQKFYDAVLLDDEGRKLNSNGRVMCEHHQGVSRHRYKHIPPMTPEGFWDIGFDTEK